MDAWTNQIPRLLDRASRVNSRQSRSSGLRASKKRLAKTTKASKQKLTRNSSYDAESRYKALADILAKGDKSEAAKDLLKEEGILYTERRLFAKQAERLACENLPSEESRRWFMHFFTRSSNGLAEPPVQGNFQESLIETQNAKHPNFAEERSHKCPITCTWLHEELTTAAYIFPWKHGQETMTRNFRTEAEHEIWQKPEWIRGFLYCYRLQTTNRRSKHGTNRTQSDTNCGVLDKTDKMMEGNIPGLIPK